MRVGIVCSIALLFLLTGQRELVAGQRRSPVIVVPGLTGSQLHAKVDKPSVRHSVCQKKSDNFFLLWLRPESMVFPFLSCFVDNSRLVFSGGKTSNAPGVITDSPGFGSTETVEYLSQVKISLTSYYYNLVNHLVTKKGYVRGVSVRGAPYDFRKAPNELGGFLSNFKKLIEETYTKNGKTRVTLVAHSMGCLLTHHFLLTQSAAWKNQFIESFFSVVGPLGGAVSSLRAEVSGMNLNVPVIQSLLVRETLRTWPSMAYLLPQTTAWGASDVIVKSSKRRYTVKDYQALFQDIGHPLGFQMLQTVNSIRDRTAAPGVKTYCILGRGVQTPAVLDYTNKKFPDEEPNIEYGDGDGSVNWKSQEICSKWQGKQSQPVITKVMNGVKHTDILRSSEFINYLSGILN